MTVLLDANVLIALLVDDHHRQVTDAYLAQLARAHGSGLAMFDQAMAKLHHDVAELVPDVMRGNS